MAEPKPKPPEEPRTVIHEGGVEQAETPAPAETGMSGEADPAADRSPHREGGMIGEG